MSFDTLVNFRDLGDYQTKDGRKIVKKKLLRSGDLAELSSHDITLLVDRYQLSNIIDFRSDKELIERPDTKIIGAKYNHIDMFKGDNEDAPALEQIEKANASRTADERMLFAYEHLLTSPVSQKGFRQFFNILLNNTDGSTIWHCFAGKDRTGLAGALVLYVLGADRDTIMEDYLRTNESRAKANASLIAGMQAQGASDAVLKDMEVMLTVKADYLEYSEKIIKDKFNSIDDYIANVLKISEDEKEYFKTLYLV